MDDTCVARVVQEPVNRYGVPDLEEIEVYEDGWGQTHLRIHDLLKSLYESTASPRLG